MVGGFLFLQARSCFLKFFRFVAFLSHFPANFQYIKTEKPTICTAFSTVNRVFFFGALEGTRIPGPLIKRIQGASFVKFQKFEETLFLSYHRKALLCTHRIICIQCNALQPLSSYSGVQKCADGQNKAHWTNQPPVLWQGLGHPNRHRLI